nr:uncharacterized protein LOC116157942 [Camelus dromedarius]
MAPEGSGNGSRPRDWGREGGGPRWDLKGHPGTRVSAARRNAAGLTHQRLLPTCRPPHKAVPSPPPPALPAARPPDGPGSPARYSPSRRAEPSAGRARVRARVGPASERGWQDAGGQSWGRRPHPAVPPVPRAARAWRPFWDLRGKKKVRIPAWVAAQGRCPACQGVSRGPLEAKGQAELEKALGFQTSGLEEGSRDRGLGVGLKGNCVHGVLGLCPLCAQPVGMEGE